MRNGQQKKFSKKKRCFEQQNGLCFFCLKKIILERGTIDHFIPLGRGGFDGFDNMVFSCKECNFKKGNKIPKNDHFSIIAAMKGTSVGLYWGLIH